MIVELPKMYIVEKKRYSTESDVNVCQGVVIENESGESVELSERYVIHAKSLEEAEDIAKKSGIEYDSIYLHPAHKQRLHNES